MYKSKLCMMFELHIPALDWWKTRQYRNFIPEYKNRGELSSRLSHIP